MRLQKYLKIWWLMSVNSSKVALTSRAGAFIFILGKLLRFLFFGLFLILLASNIKIIAGYSIWQMLFFFLSFNLIDTSIQLFLREVYRFRTYVVNGEFDYILIKPMSPLFRSLFGGSDPLDIPIFFLNILAIIIVAGKIDNISIISSLSYILLIFNGLLLALSFHIFVLAIGVMTTEVDNTIMLYRNITMMGRIPIDVYQQPLRSIITFAIPVGVMMTFPVKAFLGLLSFPFILISFLITAVFLFGSIFFWKYALTRYTSASS